MDEFCSTQPIVNADNSAFNKPVSEVPVLCVHSVGESINEFPIVKKCAIVGRDAKCDIHINSPTISRKHATLELDENGICTITDLDSLNGTKRNDLQLKSRRSYELRNGDSLHFGEVYCTIQFRQRSILSSTGENIQSKKYNESDSDPGRDALVQSSISSERVLDMETDSSALSENLLSEVVMDVGEVPCDLLPNSNYFILRPPCSSNSTNLESQKNKFHKDDCTGSPPLLRLKMEADISEVHQCRRECDTPSNNEEIHPDLKVNLSINTDTSENTTPLSTKPSKNRHSSYGSTLTIPMSLLNKQSSTPCGCSQIDLVLARDSDPGSIVQSLYNDLTVHSSTCMLAEESISSIQESDLIKTVSDKSISEEDESQKHASILPDMLNENDEPQVDLICKSSVVLLVNETEKNIASVISKKSPPLDTNFSEKCDSEDNMIKPEVMLFEECHSNILRDRSFQKHSYNNKHDSEDGKLAHSSFEECKNTISRKHATLELDENGICTITDLDSLNGTKRNDLQLRSRRSYELRNGDSLHFGEVYCTIQFRQRSILSSTGENIQSKVSHFQVFHLILYIRE
ncbi:unnamed protein product [Trichobilharzia szidati]|nr:unnamed protein product [Trichobilharzia szidati]